MKYSIFSAAALLSMAMADPGYVTIPIKRQEIHSNSTGGLIKRNSNQTAAVPEVLDTHVVKYYANIELGSPGQTNNVSIDTGSSDLWVYAPNTGAPTTYDHTKSSTSKFIDNGFVIHHNDGQTSFANYYTDEIKWGDTNINFQFAVRTDQGSSPGVFGLGSTSGESSKDGKYPNFPVALQQQGKIDSAAYSLYLDGVDSTSGTLLFGAVNTAQYKGPIKAVPITSNDTFSVDVEVFGESFTGILDSGTSLTFLPKHILEQIADQVGAKYYANDLYSAPEPLSGSVTYNFSGVEVTVPTSDLYIDILGSKFLSITSNSNSNGINILGDTFLRSAYVVYDLSNHQIAIAQAETDLKESNFVPITEEGIPGTY